MLGFSLGFKFFGVRNGVILDEVFAFDDLISRCFLTIFKQSWFKVFADVHDGFRLVSFSVLSLFMGYFWGIWTRFFPSSLDNKVISISLLWGL